LAYSIPKYSYPTHAASQSSIVKPDAGVAGVFPLNALPVVASE
jgi:hypothetical protein